MFSGLFGKPPKQILGVNKIEMETGSPTDQETLGTTVDGWNPAPPGMYETL